MSLDLASGVIYRGESVKARATQPLDKLPGHTTDVEMSTAWGHGYISPLTKERDLDSLVFDPNIECLSLLYKNLLDKSPKKVNSPSKK